MSCTFDPEKLSAFFDGELDAAERAETEVHISGCSACLRDLGELKAAALAVKSLPRLRAPRSIAEGVSREIAASGPVRSFDAWRRRLSWAVAAAAALLVVYNISYFTRMSASPETAAASKPAPALAIAEGRSDTEQRKNLRDDPAKDAKHGVDALERLEERKAASDKDGRESMRRQADDEKLRSRELLKKADNALADAAPVANPAKGESAVPAAPKADPLPAPAPKPQPAPVTTPEAKPAAAAGPLPPAPFAAEKAKEVQGALQQKQAVEAYTVSAPEAGKLRARAEALIASWSASPAKTSAALSGRLKAPASPAFGTAPEPLVLDVTPEQFEALKAELAKAGVDLQPGLPAEGGRVEKDGGGGSQARGAKVEESADRAVDPAGKRDVAARKATAATRRITILFIDRAEKK